MECQHRQKEVEIMRPIEQYGTIRRGYDILQQQEQERWMRRAAMLRKRYRRFAYRVGVQMVMWGYRLQHLEASFYIEQENR